MFPSPRRDGPLTVGWVRHRIEEVLDLASVEGTPHSLRATFGSEVARVTGGNIMAVASLLGHDSVTTSQVYVGWSPTAVCQEAVEALYA